MFVLTLKPSQVRFWSHDPGASVRRPGRGDQEKVRIVLAFRFICLRL